MSLAERIEKDFIAAYKAKEQQRLDTLRMLKTAAKNLQVETGKPLDDGQWLDIVAKQVKQRQDSIEQFSKAGRQDLADREAVELDILEAYLPPKLGEEELLRAIDEAVTASGAAGVKDMGKVMQTLMAKYKGQLDGKAASELVKKRLIAG